MEKLLLIWSNFYFQSLLKIILVVILAGIIGKERDNSHKPAGFRIYTLLGLSAVLVVLCGEFLSQRYNIDPFRIAAQFLSAIGFIGAGTILRDGFNVKGLTTASALFTVSCIGLCVGAGFYFGAIVTTIFTYVILSYSYIFTDKSEHYDIIELEISTKEKFQNFMAKLEKNAQKLDLELKQVKDITEDDEKNTTIKVICRYSTKNITRNKLFTEIASIKDIISVNEI